MAKLFIEAEGKRYTVRYSRREAVLNLLKGNADLIEDIKPPAPPVETAEPDGELPPVEPAGAPAGNSGPLNDGTATNAALKLLAKNNLELAHVDADGGRVGVGHVRAYIG